MKTFRSEFSHSYKTYSFGYCEYIEIEKGDLLDGVYAQGFLPYSGTPNVRKTLYRARSSRVNLDRFLPNSENRRIAKIFDEKLTRRSKPLGEFNYQDKEFLNFCLTYFDKRHGPKIMPRKRLLTILESGFPLNVISYTNGNNRIVGYAFEVVAGDMGHYWYSFYDLSYAYQSLGMWIMLDCVREAKKAGMKHYYVGTVYGEKALYKTNLDSIEFHNGNDWISDVKLLRKLSKNDVHHMVDIVDRWKETHELF